jgi:hypothetical protein
MSINYKLLHAAGVNLKKHPDQLAKSGLNEQELKEVRWISLLTRKREMWVP